MLIDNIDWTTANIIRVPRYRSLEKDDRRGQILVNTSFEDVSGYSKDNLVGPIYNERRNNYWKFDRVHDGSGVFYIKFGFTTLVCVSSVILQQTKNVSHGIWKIQYYDEGTELGWIDLSNNFNWEGRRKIINNDTEEKKAALMYRLVHMSGKTNATGEIKAVNFITEVINVVM